MSDRRFTFHSVGCEALPVTLIRGREALSDLFSFKVDFVAPEQTNVEGVLGQDACVSIRQNLGFRYLQGVVFDLRLVEILTEQRRIYSAVLMPHLRRLCLNRRMRIFQQQTTPEIIDVVFADNSLKNVAWHLDRAQYKPRDYCVQYRETDFDFVSRLLEEEGITYYFEHDKDALRTVLTDDMSTLTP